MNPSPHSNSSDPLKTRVLDRIKHDNLAMQPRWRFVLHSVTVAIGVMFALITLLFIMSFVIFMLRVSGVWFAPSFGVRGFQPFFWSLPWLLLLVAVGFAALLEFSLRSYAVAYRRPLVVTGLVVIVLSAGGGLMIAQTQLHHALLRQAEEQHLPFAGSFYRHFAAPPQQYVHPGFIQDISGDSFELQNRRQELLHVLITHDTKLPPAPAIVSGDFVIVFGKRVDGTVTAIGVRRANPETWERSGYRR